MLESRGHARIDPRSPIPRFLQRRRPAHGRVDVHDSRPQGHRSRTEKSSQSTSLEQIESWLPLLFNITQHTRTLKVTTRHKCIINRRAA